MLIEPSNNENKAKCNGVVALILAGGAGRRFAGLDKGLQLYNGRPLIDHVITAIEPQVERMIISANRNQEIYQQYGLELISDVGELYQGPMAGISAAITLLNKQYTNTLLVSCCDSPLLPNNYVAKLVLEQTNSSVSVAVVHDGKRRQNLHCLISRKAWPSLLDFYESGGRAMYQWLSEIDANDVDFSADAALFSNINSPDQL